MVTRVLVSLQAGADQAAALADLDALGSASVRSPQLELPDVAVAEVDDTAVEPEEWAHRAAAVPGVQTAEVDRIRWSY